MTFFFSFFRYFDFYLAFRGAFRYGTQLGGRRIGPTSEGVVAFAALPDAYALAPNFDEAALGATMGGFESRDNFYISLADGGAVSCP